MSLTHDSGTRPHVAIVAMFFPPSRASGVYRPLATANLLVQMGWDVTVVTAEPSFFDDITGSRDDSLVDAIDPRVRVERVPVPSQHLQRDVRRMSRLRADWPLLATAGARIGQKVFPDRYVTWLPGVVRRLVSVHRQRRLDVVLATGNPWTAFRAAHDFGRLARVPYVMDYRDSWTLDQFSERPAFPDDSREVAAERRLIEAAARVVHVNEPMLEWHAERYPRAAQRMLVVENGFDPELLGEVKQEAPPPDRPLRFGYLGTITSHLPHAATWQGWNMALGTHPELAGATAHLYGHLGFFPRDAQTLRALIPGPEAGVHLEGPVAKADVRTAYESLDVLLMMIPSSRFVTAGKTYECLATGKPVVAIHTPETAATGPMRGYPLWFPVRSVDGPAVADALVEAARAARSATPEVYAAARAHAEKYRRENQVRVLDAALREVVTGA